MHWFSYRQMAPLLIYKLNWMWTNNVQLVEIRGLQIIVHGKHSQQQTLPLMWSTAFKKEHTRRRWWYNLLIKIEKEKKTLRCLWEKEGRKLVISHYLDLIPLLPTQRRGNGEARDEFLSPAPGAGQRQVATGRPQLGGTGWPAGVASLGGHALRFLCHLTCHPRDMGLLQTSATFRVVAKHSKNQIATP